jgi:hypothetical protein
VSSKGVPKQDGTKTEYEALARYYTDGVLARVLIDLLPIRRHDRVYEGHVGGGSWVNAVLRRSAALGWTDGPKIACNDFDKNAPGLRIQDPRICHRSVGDFLEAKPCWRPNWVLGNPPYSLPRLNPVTGKTVLTSVAEDHVRRALSLGDNVAFLLRLNFLGGDERSDLWQTHPAKHVYVLSQRPSFTTDGSTDSCEYAMFVWESGWRGQTALDVVSWR